MAWFIYNTTHGQLVSFKKKYLGKWGFLVQEYEKFAQKITMSANQKIIKWITWLSDAHVSWNEELNYSLILPWFCKSINTSRGVHTWPELENLTKLPDIDPIPTQTKALVGRQ